MYMITICRSGKRYFSDCTPIHIVLGQCQPGNESLALVKVYEKGSLCDQIVVATD